MREQLLQIALRGGNQKERRMETLLAEEPPIKAKKVIIDDEQEDARSIKSGSDKRSGKSGSSSKGGKKNEKEVEEVKKVTVKAVPLPGDFEWYGDPLNPGIDASLGKGGELFGFTKKNGPRAGMCNPPMNEAIRALLMKDLNDFGTNPIVIPKTNKDREAERAEQKAMWKERAKKPEPKPETPVDEDNMSVSELMAYAKVKAKKAREKERLAARQKELLGDLTTEPDPGWLASLSQSQPSTSFHGGSAGSSRISSAAHQHHHRAGSPATKARGKAKQQFQLKGVGSDGKPKKPGLESGPDGAMKYHHFALKRMARDHGFLIEKTSAPELAELGFYHNWFSRGPLSHPPPIVQPVHPSRQLKNLGQELVHNSQSLPNISLDTAAMLIPKPEVFTNMYNLGPEAGAPSIERLLEMSKHVAHATPHALQNMCRTAGICVHTTRRLAADFEAMGNQMNSDEDPLFSGRQGGTPRTSTGKPLPVPFWGKNGNAPSLRDSEELTGPRLGATKTSNFEP